MLRSAISAFTRVFDALWRGAADPGPIPLDQKSVGPGSAEQRYVLHRVRDTRALNTKKTPPGGNAGRGLLSGRNSRTSACAAPGRSFRLLRSIDHLNDATRTRLDQYRLAVHDRVAIGRHAERLRHVVIGYAGFRQHPADDYALGNRVVRYAFTHDVFAEGRPLGGRDA